jgi:hypothetical protein
MAQSSAVWLVVLAAMLAANLPFLNDRLLAVVPLASGRKSLAWRVLELALFYGAVGALAYALERQVGNVAVQGWEFYAVTATLFLTLAFPGFVWRYLYKRRN